MQPLGAAPSQSESLTVNGLLRRVGGSLLLNAVCPWLAYQVLTSRGASVVVAHPECQAAQILVYMGVDLASLRARLGTAADRSVRAIMTGEHAPPPTPVGA